jgi:Rod binding domain-containing protein
MEAVAPALPVATPEQKARIDKVAHDFEASFLQVMLGQMFDTVQTGGFSGGEGEQAFKSFLTDAFAKSMAAQGGVGLARQMTHELLKLQGLSEGAPAA